MARLSEHFTSEEFACRCDDPECAGKQMEPHPALILRLETLRSAVRGPVIVNSGIRCPAYNAAVGGAPDSAHVTGEAADIKCVTSLDRYWLLRAVNTAGFRRIGISDRFIHVDVARKHHAQDVLWLYPQKGARS